MSGDARSLHPQVLEEIAELSVADQAAVRSVADKLHAAIAQEEGLGLLGLALFSAELQEQAAAQDLFDGDNALLINDSDAQALRGAS